MKAQMNTGGWNKKRINLAQMIVMFQTVAFHAAIRYREQLITVQLNFQPIGRRSGMLARSPEVSRTDDGAIVFINRSMAPYADKVAKYSRDRFGDTYMVLAYDEIMPEIRRRMEAEFRRAASMIAAGRMYKYQNPFI